VKQQTAIDMFEVVDADETVGVDDETAMRTCKYGKQGR